jgi:hypothetical protein
MELGIPASGGPRTRLPSATADDGDLVWEDVVDEDEEENEEEKTGEDDRPRYGCHRRGGVNLNH